MRGVCLQWVGAGGSGSGRLVGSRQVWMDVLTLHTQTLRLPRYLYLDVCVLWCVFGVFDVFDVSNGVSNILNCGAH